MPAAPTSSNVAAQQRNSPKSVTLSTQHTINNLFPLKATDQPMSAAATIVLYLDLISPYSYIAFSLLTQLRKGAWPNIDLTLRPVSLPHVMQVALAPVIPHWCRLQRTRRRQPRFRLEAAFWGWTLFARAATTKSPSSSRTVHRDIHFRLPHSAPSLPIR